VTKEALATLNDDPINNIIVDALNDAVSDIYYRNRWNWAKGSFNVQWNSTTNEYALPGNFMRMAYEPAINSVQLKEVSSEEWWRNIYTPSWNSSANMQGQPAIYMTEMTTLRVWPKPSDSFVAQFPSTPIIYYKKAPIRLTLASDSAKSPEVPAEFTEILCCYGMGKLKEFLQYSDFSVDLDRYEKLLMNRIQTDIISVHPTRIRPRNWRTTNFG
jgi:hypothetical protein